MSKKSDNSLPLLEDRLSLFKLNKIDRDIFTWTGKSVGWARIFGGQVMAQTLIAAYQTIEKKHLAHSFHGYFLRPGQMDKPIVFDVDRIRDGRSFFNLEESEPFRMVRLFLTHPFLFKKEKRA
jgi:acyl-CoA thioesterase-2